MIADELARREIKRKMEMIVSPSTEEVRWQASRKDSKDPEKGKKAKEERLERREN